ncbi:MAG: type 2 lanthipeptide synthetase LanM family protein, partial [Ktedonobacteraceae bacterium]
MKEVPAKTSAAPRTLQDSVRWYQATTLSERIALLQKNPLIPLEQTLARVSDAHAEKKNPLREPLPSQTSAERATQRFKQWKGQLPFRSEQNFTQRLAAELLTEEDLLTLLAQPAEVIQAAFDKQPSWLRNLLSAFEHQDTSSLPIQNVADTHTQAVYQTIQPLLARGFAHLHIGIAELQASYTHLPFDPQNIGLLLFPHIFDQLVSKLTKTLVLELNVARIQGRLRGETPEQRFDYFLQQLAQPEQMLTLLEEYPVLARQMVEMIERWVICELEFLQRLCADWDELCRLFSPTEDPGSLSEIHEGAGDLHHGGHSVMTLTWSSGLRLVYKPRPLALDVHFQEVLTWLNAQGCQPAFRTLKLLNKDTHGWCEFITAQGCASKAEIERFYQRLGGYLALLYCLEATDFHVQNLIAMGEDPMLIDLETLFHPRFGADDSPENASQEMLNHSVLRVGLLPQHVQSDGDGASFDLSGLTGQANQMTPFPVATWQGKGTDEMHVTRERMEIPLGEQHRPKLRDQEIETLDYKQSIIAGFTTVYQLLLKHRDELLTSILPRFTHDEVRVLVRPTQHYAMLQTDSFHPNVLRDALDRDRIFERLWIGVDLKPTLARMILAERADLWREDIPKFTTTPDSRDLVTTHGEIITDFFPESSRNLVRKCIQRLGELDLTRQVWIIQASLSSLALNTNHTRKSGLQLHPAEAQATNERLLSEAQAIGERLHKLALIREDSVNWLSVNILGGREWSILPVSLDLYGGLPGIALFLAHLGALTGEKRYTTLARLALQTLRVQMRSQQAATCWNCIGAFSGAGSVIYLLSHLGTLWQEPALYEEAAEIVTQLPNLIRTDEYLDVIAGSAGCIAALLSLYACVPSEQTLAAALQCGDHLLKHARSQPQGIAWLTKNETTPLAGMGHGTAGIALNLLRLWAISKEERFHEAALAAMAYERSLFSAPHHNWPDLR